MSWIDKRQLEPDDWQWQIEQLQIEIERLIYNDDGCQSYFIFHQCC